MQTVAYSRGTKFRVNRLLEGMISKYGNLIDGVAIINERGLIIEATGLTKHTSDAMAAMTALLSSTAYRVAGNLRLSKPRTIKIKTDDAVLIIVESNVYGRQFWLGIIARPRKRPQFRFFKRCENIEDIARDCASRIRDALEGK